MRTFAAVCQRKGSSWMSHLAMYKISIPIPMALPYRSTFQAILPLLKHCLLLCLVVLTEALYGQTMVKLTDGGVKIKNPTFYIDEIVDARSNKDIIGIVQRGLKNEKQTAVLDGDIVSVFRIAIGKLAEANKVSTPVAMRILKLNVFERTLISSETGVAEVIIEFYVKKESGYVFIMDAGSTAMSKGLNVTGSHARNIERCLEDCFDQLNKSLFDFTWNNSKTVNREVLLAIPDILDDYTFPILTATEVPSGVYRNFVEFRNNKPGARLSSSPDKMNSASSYDIRQGKLYSEDGEESDVWGYFDGDKFFVKVGLEFFELAIDDGIFWFNGYDISKIESKLNMSGKSIVMAAFTGFFFYDIRYNAQLKPVRYAINLGNGDLVSLD